MATLYHICTEAEWQDAQGAGEYRAPSLAAEGFIHCSTQEQVAGTAARFFAGRQGLVLLVIERSRVAARVQDDEVGGHGRFPHVYGPLNLDAVTDVRLFAPDAEGVLRAPA